MCVWMCMCGCMGFGVKVGIGCWWFSHKVDYGKVSHIYLNPHCWLEMITCIEVSFQWSLLLLAHHTTILCPHIYICICMMLCIFVYIFIHELFCCRCSLIKENYTFMFSGKIIRCHTDPERSCSSSWHPEVSRISKLFFIIVDVY